MDLNKQYILNYSIKNEIIKSKIDLSIQLKDMYIFYLDIKVLIMILINIIIKI